MCMCVYMLYIKTKQMCCMSFMLSLSLKHTYKKYDLNKDKKVIDMFKRMKNIIKILS